MEYGNHKHSGFASKLLSIAFALIPIGIAIGTVGSERNLNFIATTIQDMSIESKGNSILLLQIFSIFIVLSSLAILTVWARTRNSKKMPFEAKQLLFALLGFYFFSVIFNTIIGRGSIQLNNTYPVLMFIAVVASTTADIELALRTTKKVLLVFFLIGFTYIFINESTVLQRDYEGWIPNVDVRFHGLAAHANSAGPLAITMLLLEMTIPSKNKIIKWIIIFTGGLALLMSQSKTSWIAALISILLVYWYRLDTSRRVPLSRIVIPTSIITSTMFILVSFITDVNPIETLFGGLDEQTMTLSGRAAIWETAIDEWVNNPFFGYGGGIWNEEYRRSIDMMFAFHAHNQILQTLSTAGLVGLVSFIFYGFMLLSKLMNIAKSTEGIAGSFCTLLIVGSVSEIPFLMTNVMTAEVLVHLVIFSFIVRHIYSNQIDHSKSITA